MNSFFIPFTPIGKFKWINGKIYESNLPKIFDYWKELELEVPEKIITLVRDRLRSQRKLLISSVRDRREDQPVASLKIGLTKSRSVCRIARYFSREDFRTFIEEIQEDLGEPGGTENFDSIAKLKEIFLIPNEIADDIFTTVRGRPPEKLSENSSEDELLSVLYLLEIAKLLNGNDFRVFDFYFHTLIQQRQRLKYSLELLNALKELTESQLAKINPIPVGTGFLVSPNHLLTNYHVLFNEEVTRQCVAQFDYEESLGTQQKTVDYEFEPEAMFVGEPSLDYALVQLRFNSFNRQAGHNFGWLDLVEDYGNIIPGISGSKEIQESKEGKEFIDKLKKTEFYEFLEEGYKGDNVILIHHPKGGKKKIDLTNNRVIEGGLYKKFLRYQGDSDYGSSGCPVFNTKWELVALNHAAITKSDTSNGEVLVKQGIRICQIIADLKRKAPAYPKLKSFIENFVIISEQLNYPPLSSALTFNGINSYVSLDGIVVFASVQGTTIQLWGKRGVILKKFDFVEEVRIFLSQPDKKNDKKITEYLNRLNSNTRLFEPKFSGDGNILAIISHDGIIALWKLNQFSIVDVVYHEKNKYTDIYFSPYSQTLAAVSSHGKITLWNLDDKKVKLNKKLSFWNQHTDEPRYALQFISDNDLIGVTPSGQIIKWNQDKEEWNQSPEGNKKIETEKFGNPHKLAISPDCKKLVSIQDNVIKTWHIDQEIKLINKGKITQIKDAIQHIEISHNSTFLVIKSDRKFIFLNLQSNNVNRDKYQLKKPDYYPWIYLTPFKNAMMVIVKQSSQELQFIQIPDLQEKNPDLQEKNKFRKSLRNNLKLPTLTLKNTGYLIGFNSSTFKDSEKNILTILRSELTSELTSEFTIEAWVNPEPSSKVGTIMSNLSSRLNNSSKQANESDYLLEVSKQQKSVIGKVLFSLFHQASDDSSKTGKGKINKLSIDKLTAPLVFGEFSHIAVTCTVTDGQKQILRLYVNGQKFDEKDISKESMPLYQFRKDNFPKIIGALVSDGIGKEVPQERKLTNFFQGAITEVRFWGKARNQEQIKEKMHCRLCQLPEEELKSLVGYWRFEEGTGSQVYNLVHNPMYNESYGIADNTKWINTVQLPSLFPSGLKFNTQHDYINCIGSATLNTTDAITIEAWVKYQYGNCLILNRLDQKNKGYSLGWHDEKIRVILKSDSQETVVDTKDRVPHNNMWHHIAFTWDKKNKDTGEISIYVDGILQETNVVKGEHKSIVFEGEHRNIGVFKGDFGGLNIKFRIGGCEENSENFSQEEQKHSFGIVIAQVRVWKVTRSQADLRFTMSKQLFSHKLSNDSNDSLEEWKNQGLVGYWRLDGQDNQDDEIKILNLVANNRNNRDELKGKISPFPSILNKPVAFDIQDIGGHWAEAFMTMIVNRGLMFDFIKEDSSIAPDQLITREEFVKVIAQAFPIAPIKEQEQSKQEFLDVNIKEKPSLYFAIQRAYQIGFLLKASEKKFNPQHNLQRQEAIFHLIEGLKFRSEIKSWLDRYTDDSKITEGELSRYYSDFQEIDSAYEAAIATATQAKIIVSLSYSKSTSFELKPTEKITRAELAAWIYQALVAIDEAPSLNSPYIVDPTSHRVSEQRVRKKKKVSSSLNGA